MASPVPREPVCVSEAGGFGVCGGGWCSQYKRHCGADNGRGCCSIKVYEVVGLWAKIHYLVERFWYLYNVVVVYSVVLVTEGSL